MMGSPRISDRARKRLQNVGRLGFRWETDYSTEVSDTRKRKGRMVIKRNPDMA